MIAIPNMEKPKGCYYCPLEQLSECRLLGNKFVEEIDPNDCPLIEIDDEAIDIAEDIIDGCKRFKERRTDESNTERD